MYFAANGLSLQGQAFSHRVRLLRIETGELPRPETFAFKFKAALFQLVVRELQITLLFQLPLKIGVILILNLYLKEI